MSVDVGATEINHRMCHKKYRKRTGITLRRFVEQTLEKPVIHQAAINIRHSNNEAFSGNLNYQLGKVYFIVANRRTYGIHTKLTPGVAENFVHRGTVVITGGNHNLHTRSCMQQAQENRRKHSMRCCTGPRVMKYVAAHE